MTAYRLTEVILVDSDRPELSRSSLPHYTTLSYVRTSAPNFLSQMEDRQPVGRVHDQFWQRGGGYDRHLIEPKAI